jgi:protein-tyrosine phosphatase
VTFFRIMTVCTGNICRSPLAAAYLSKHLPSPFTISSSGLAAVEGASAQENIRKLALLQGLDISAHSGTQITERMALENDLLFVMTSSQKNELERRFPSVKGRAFLLGQWGTGEIPDPYGGVETDYVRADRQIRKAVAEWLPKLLTF